ncbi:unnamed protein product [Caretta caretta]
MVSGVGQDTLRREGQNQAPAAVLDLDVLKAETRVRSRLCNGTRLVNPGTMKHLLYSTHPPAIHVPRDVQ